MNGDAAADKDEPNCGMHHSLREQIGQLVDRERVLCSENDQLRAQLVEMKEQEKKKYDDLMVQYYNVKREYEDDGLDRDGATVKQEIKEEIKEEEDDGLDKQGTSNNQVTVKTEWNHEEVKVEIKEEGEKEHNIIIKREYVPAYIKTESSDVKVEIKEEEDDDEDHDDDCGCDRFVKKEEVEDQIEEWVKREIKEVEEEEEVNETTINEEMVEVKEEIKEVEEEDGSAEIDSIEGWAESNQGGEDECGSVEKASMDTTRAHPTGQSQNASNANEVCVANLSSDQHNTTTLNEPYEVTTVTQSTHNFLTFSPQTSTGHGSIRTALDQRATVPTRHKVTKRKQQTSKRSVKRSKKSVEENDDGEGGEDIANEDREEAKIKVLNLNCTQSNCNVKLDSLEHLHNHLRTVHQLSPHQCFAQNCNARFDDPNQLRDHIKRSHSCNTRFLCSVCHKEYDSQTKAKHHWYQNHQTGQFQCNLVNDCAEMTVTRGKMTTHQKAKHHSQSKRFNCTHPGCTASFAFNADMKRHQLTHLDTNQFHCNWPHCSKQCKLRTNLVIHIRTQHFGLPKSMKAQKEKNIVDLRDPNEYVRVLVDE